MVLKKVCRETSMKVSHKNFHLPFSLVWFKPASFALLGLYSNTSLWPVKTMYVANQSEKCLYGHMTFQFIPKLFRPGLCVGHWCLLTPNIHPPLSSMCTRAQSTLPSLETYNFFFTDQFMIEKTFIQQAQIRLC